jgi:hypothetical protein
MYAAYLFILRAFDAASRQTSKRQSDSERGIADRRLPIGLRSTSAGVSQTGEPKPIISDQGSEGRSSANRDGEMPHASRTLHYSEHADP